MAVLEYEKKGRIAYVTLNRPDKMNSLNSELLDELAKTWQDFRDDDEVWVAILTGAGSEPARSTIARSRASSIVKRPVIWACPPDIFSWITGAEYTLLSRMIAMRRLTFFLVIRSKSFAPLELNARDT